MSKPVLTDLDFTSASRILNLLDPTLAQHPATKAYVDSAVEGLAWKDSVRVASTATITLSGPGASIDGITMAVNDRFLAKDQASAFQNGIYVWNGAAVPATRAADMNTAAEVEQAITTVEEGTSAGATFRQTAVNVTLDTTNLAWASFGTAAAAASETLAGVAELATQAETDAGVDDLRIVTPLKLKTSKLFAKIFSQSIGDASATTFNIDHNLNTRDCQVSVYKNSGNYDEVIVDITRPTVNRVTVSGFPTAPGASAYRVTVLGVQV